MGAQIPRALVLILVVVGISCSSKEEPADVKQNVTASESDVVLSGDIEPLVIDETDGVSTIGLRVDENESFAAPNLTVATDSAIERLGVQMNRNPKALHEFVRQETAFETYTGVLKGARGTYLTKAGNSADRALLLAKLIQGDGRQPDVRFAICDITSPVSPLSTTPRQTNLREVQRNVTDPELNTGVRWLDGALTRARHDAKLLEGRLSAAVAPTLKSILEARKAVERGETVHVWPQVEHDGVWKDLDPSSATGAPPCSPKATSGDIPDELFHRVSLTVIVETLQANALQESVALRVEKLTSEISASQIVFTFGEAAGLLESRDSSDGLARYTPVLRIDNENWPGEPLTLPRIRSEAGPQDVGGGFADVLGGDFYGGYDQGSAPAEEVMSAWIQIELSSPGQESVKARSEIFDRLGMAIRLNAGDSTFGLLPLEIVDGEYSALASIWQIGVVVGELASPETLLQVSTDVSALDGVSAVLDRLARAYPTVRRELGGRPAAPVIMLVGMVPSVNASGESAGRLVFDVLHVSSEPPDDTATASRDAVASPLAEYVLAALVGGSSTQLDDVASVMRAAIATSVPFQIVEVGKKANVEGASSNALARMNSRSRQGYTLATTAQAVGAQDSMKTAWWYVDPSTGVIRDEHENGRHTAVTDRAIAEKDTPSTMATIRNFACKIAKPVVIGASAIYLLTGGVVGKDALKFVAKVQEGYQKQRAVADKALMIACGDRQRLGGAGTPPPPVP